MRSNYNDNLVDKNEDSNVFQHNVNFPTPELPARTKLILLSKGRNTNVIIEKVVFTKYLK